MKNKRIFEKTFLTIFLICSITNADNWATYMHDTSRSGISTDPINVADLNQTWKISPPAPPMIAWDGGMPWDAWRSPSEAAVVRSTPMRDFDFVNFITTADGNLYYGSSLDDSVHCLDTGSGNEKWVFTTDGPVRFPPTIYNNKLYFSSDDGYAYCLDANAGTQIWKYTPAVPVRLIANNGKFISMQPIRTGVTIYDGKAYFASSLVPWKSSYLCAVDANTGAEIYKVSGGTTPMGALLISSSRIYIPQGRLPPAVFNRADGSSAGSVGPYGQGGCYALLTSDSTPRFSYGWDRQHASGYNLYEYNADTLTSVSEHLNGRHMIVKNGTAYLLSDTTLSAINRSDSSTIWSVAADCCHSLIFVDGVLFAGGFNKVVAYDSANGNELATVNIEGTARGLATAGQRLFVSTDDGAIYAFGEADKPIINNSAATDITDTSVTCNGHLVSTGAAATCVILYWGETDEGTNFAAWSHSIPFGQRVPGNLLTNISSLNPKTTYYYKYCAANAFGRARVGSSKSFKTYSAPIIDNNSGANSIGINTARLNANLSEGISADVTFYWGTTAGGTTPANWQFHSVVSNVSEGAVFLDASGFATNTTYYYTSHALNSYGSDWALTNSYFKTKATVDDGWTHKIIVSFPGYNKTEILTNFPALIILNESISGFHYSDFASNEGGDLRFLNYDRNEFLNFEIEKWDTSGNSYVWVQLPLLFNEMNGIVAEWGNPHETNLPAYTSDGSTWSEHYVGVWHLNYIDNICHGSSSNANNGSCNYVTHITNGQIDGADDFNGSNSFINAPSTSDLRPTRDMSVSLWINPDASMADWACPLANAWDDGGKESGYSMSYVTGKLRFMIETASMANNEWNSNPGYAITVGSWQHVAGTYDGSTIRYYVDADQKETRSASGNINWNFSPQGFYIGKFHDNNEDNYYDGKVDEVRISDIARSADWLWADQQTMANNSSFTSYVIPEPCYSCPANVEDY